MRMEIDPNTRPKHNQKTSKYYGIRTAAFERDRDLSTHAKHHWKTPMLTEYRRPSLKEEEIEMPIFTPNTTRKPRYSRNICIQPSLKEIGIPIRAQNTTGKPQCSRNTNGRLWARSGLSQYARETPLENPKAYGIQATVFEGDRDPTAHAKHR